MTLAQPAADVTVLVPNLDGARPLRACLESLAALKTPSGHVDVLMIDNGSRDGSVDVARQAGASVLELGENLGFAAAVNAGARAATSRDIAMLNNDMVVDPGWLEALLAARRTTGAACVGGLILDWSGDAIDFAGGVVNFHGFGEQPGFGEAPEGQLDARVGEPFACGGSMFIDRELFLDVGGFDDSYFAYFEDVDLGWRLNVLGHHVAFAPASRCRHRHHGTSRRMAPAQRQLLLERNALITLLKNVDDETLQRTLGPALLLLVGRTLDRSLSPRDRYEPFAHTPGSERVPATALAGLHAVGDVLADLPGILERRSLIQARRAATDAEVLPRLRAWTEPIGATSDAYRAAFARVLALLDGTPPTPLGESARLGGSRGRLRDLAARHPRLPRLARLS